MANRNIRKLEVEVLVLLLDQKIKKLSFEIPDFVHLHPLDPVIPG